MDNVSIVAEGLFGFASWGVIALLMALTYKLLIALGDYLGWLSVKGHEITDPEIRECLSGVQPPPYLQRLLLWLASWMMCAAAVKTFVTGI